MTSPLSQGPEKEYVVLFNAGASEDAKNAIALTNEEVDFKVASLIRKDGLEAVISGDAALSVFFDSLGPSFQSTNPRTFHSPSAPKIVVLDHAGAIQNNLVKL